jgi:arabinogalactan endo-1,4-beta-galactosidase
MTRKKITVLLLFFALAACRPQAGSAPTPSPLPAAASFAKGADISWLTQMEASGKKFYNAAGAETEGIALMKSLGMNTIRLRVWVNPSPAYNNAADVVAKAIRAKNLGMRIMIDFHYSDSWADPGKQTKPAAWAGQDVNGLKIAVAAHTTDVLTQLKNNGITPEWVQVGNETNNGMLWPEGKASTSMASFAQMINAGYDAVKTAFPSAKVIVHVSNGYDNTLFRWMFDGLQLNGAKYDVIGMSLYPTAANWASINTQCLTNMNDMVSRYGKEVMVVEVGMPWDNAADCKSFLSDIISKIVSVSGNKGLGVLYWEPQAYNNWQGYTLGAFDNSGKPTAALAAFQ